MWFMCRASGYRMSLLVDVCAEEIAWTYTRAPSGFWTLISLLEHFKTVLACDQGIIVIGVRIVELHLNTLDSRKLCKLLACPCLYRIPSIPHHLRTDRPFFKEVFMYLLIKSLPRGTLPLNLKREHRLLSAVRTCWCLVLTTPHSLGNRKKCCLFYMIYSVGRFFRHVRCPPPPIHNHGKLFTDVFFLFFF